MSDHQRELTSEPTAPAESGEAGASEFESLAREPEPGLLKEFGYFLIENKAWWMVPILVVLGLLFALAWLTSTGAAPFIYPLF